MRAPTSGGWVEIAAATMLVANAGLLFKSFNVLVGVSQDAVAEVKILLTNYQAEYGRSSGGTINVVIKNGTRDFHGGGFYFKRHEQFNANNFFNNLNGLPKPLYRYNTWSGTIGGPIIKDKLHFFASQEWNRETRGVVRRLKLSGNRCGASDGRMC